MMADDIGPNVVRFPNRPAYGTTSDKGSCFLEHTDAGQLVVTVRSPGERHESKVPIPFDIWLEMIECYRARPPV